MTRFLYIADTHLGANPMGYQQQPAYPERLHGILAALKDHMASIGGVDFILHGGDMIDAATDDNIRAAVSAFDLGVPVRLCLGNHDLTVPDAVERWLRLAPGFFVDGQPDYTIATNDCVVHVVPNHWCEIPFYWNDKQEAQFSAAQSEALAQGLGAMPHVPHFILTHSPVHGLPVEQTGLAEPHHAPNLSFTAAMTDLVAWHPSTMCVLGAHNHMNMRVTHGGVEFVTASALVETPFEFKRFEVTPHAVTMSTVSLGAAAGIASAYNPARAYVQGRGVDRAFTRRLSQTFP